MCLVKLPLGQGWNVGGSLQYGDLTLTTGPVRQDAATLSAGYRDKVTVAK